MKVKSIIAIAFSLTTISLSMSVQVQAKGIKEWAKSEAVITKTDGTKTNVSADSFIHCTHERLELNGGQNIDFEKMQSFEVIRADEVRGEVLIKLLNGNTIRDIMDVRCNDVIGTNNVGRFAVPFPKLKRVDFQRSNLSSTPSTPANATPSKPVSTIPNGRLKLWKSSDAVITKTDGTTTTVYADSLAQCVSAQNLLYLQRGQSIEFEKMRSFEVIEADESTARVVVTMLDGNIIKDSVDVYCNDVFGTNSSGRFTVFFPQLKRVDFQRFN